MASASNDIPIGGTDGLGFPATTIFDALTRKGVEPKYFFNDLPVAALWGAQGLLRSARVEEYYLRAAQGRCRACRSSTRRSSTRAAARRATSTRTATCGSARPSWPTSCTRSWSRRSGSAARSSSSTTSGAASSTTSGPPRVPDRRNSRDLAEDYGQMGPAHPGRRAVAVPASRGHVDHGTYGFESILKMIRYRFGLKPLTRRDAYARNIARSFDWEGKPRLTPPALPDPPAIVGQQCAGRDVTLLDRRTGKPIPAPERPKPHDMETLLTSGYLDRLGFDYKPATASSTFRNPNLIEQLLKENPWQ